MEERCYQKISLLSLLIIMVSAEVYLLAPSLLQAQPIPSNPLNPPPIEARFVREGDFAAALAYRLGVTDGRNQTQAEGQLASLGIAPRNGWVSDDPVTPDIVGDLEAAVTHAADANALALSRDEALRQFAKVLEESGVSISTGSGNAGYASSGPITYPDQPGITDYYVSEGPPAITYYEPPPAYYYLYSWVPYPFWYGGLAFGGYYILKDHRHYDHHHRGYVSNTWQHGAGQNYRAYPSRGLKGQGNDHYSGHAAGRSQWSQEVPSSMVSRPANVQRNRMSAPHRQVAPTAVPHQSGRSERMVRGELSSPSTARPSVRAEMRFSQPRTVHPSPSPPGTAGIRQGTQGTPHGEGFRQPAAGGWSRGFSGGHPYAGRGYAGFRR